MVVFDVAAGFGEGALAPIAYEQALHRVKVFCTRSESGWITYDLAAHHARTAGQFSTVTPWSMLYADALAGQVTIRDVANFTLERRRSFAALLQAVPEDVGLAVLDEQGLDAVSDVCRFGSPVYGARRSPRSQRCIARTRCRCSTATSRWCSGSPGTGSRPTTAARGALGSVRWCALWPASCRPRELSWPSCAATSRIWCPRSG
jgi:hypothetical protein